MPNKTSMKARSTIRKEMRQLENMQPRDFTEMQLAESYMAQQALGWVIGLDYINPSNCVGVMAHGVCRQARGQR